MAPEWAHHAATAAVWFTGGIAFARVALRWRPVPGRHLPSPAAPSRKD